MEDLVDTIDRLAAETQFSGVVRVDVAADTVLAKAYGLADRAHQVPNAVDTRFALASGTKGLTALTVASLIEDGQLSLDSTARTFLGDDLPLIGDDVTVEHLLAHRSGIGDYLAEDDTDDITDHVLTVPVSDLASTEAYLPLLAGHPVAFAPDESFSYNNGGFVVLALLAERATGRSFPELVEERVCGPAGMAGTAFLRTDELPGGAATGYLAADGLRTNVLHLPVRGSGDGGAYATAADIDALWSSLFAGRIVPVERVRELVRPRSDVSADSMRYGLGFWLHEADDAVLLEGYDAGISFRSVHDPAGGFTHTVLSNWSDGAWPIARFLDGSFRP